MAVASRPALWVPPVGLMGLIFFFSAQPDLSSGLGVIDFVLRKIVHMAEYALLAVLWCRALRTTTSERNALIAALTITVLYACSDEYHQTFVEGRHGTPVDVLIDTVGASLGLFAATRARARAARARAGRRR
jgi:VanZ family protein